MKIGEQLQKQRKAHKMSQDTLAKELHISRQSVSKWENGATLPSFSNVIAISELFDISLDDLIKGDVELMDELESKSRWMSRTKWIAVISIVGAIVAVVIMRFLKISWTSIDDFMGLPQVIALVGLLVSIKWKDFDKILNKKVIVWGTFWIVFCLIPIINDMAAGFWAGFNGR